MSEPTQENILIRDEKPADTNVRVPIYDATAKNRFEFTVRENGQKYEVAHVFGELTDDRYLQWLKEMNVKGSEDNVEEESREASCRLWDDLIDTVEGVEFEAGDWKSFVPFAEKVSAVSEFMAVATADDDLDAKKPAKRRLGPTAADVTVITESWFNNEVVQQKHTLRAPSVELEKKYSRIQGKRFKQEPVKGFRKKSKVTFVPQDEKLGELYDEMLIDVSGFAVGFDNKPTVPLRFKTAVLHEIFASPIDPKK